MVTWAINSWLFFSWIHHPQANGRLSKHVMRIHWLKTSMSLWTHCYFKGCASKKDPNPHSQAIDNQLPLLALPGLWASPFPFGPSHKHRQAEKKIHAAKDTSWYIATLNKLTNIWLWAVRSNPPKYGLIWYSTSILGSWNSHWHIP